MADKISLWLCGPLGKMGSELRNALEIEDDIDLNGVISPEHVGQTIKFRNKDLEVSESLNELSDKTALPDVIFDFTYAEVAYNTAIFCAENNIHFVTGTTGLSQNQKDEIIRAFKESKANAILASNFSVGAVLMMHFAAQAAKHFSNIEIVETHHTQKKDAPSGTAITTREMIVESSNHAADFIPIHSLRLPGAVAHQQVHLSSKGEILRIEHDANDRSCFMPGIILAIRKVDSTEDVLFSIEKLLF
ncbi:MAG: 4-hydroxy-tetrahydrodipicolinate reductase [Acidimicrobiia bacterium]